MKKKLTSLFIFFALLFAVQAKVVSAADAPQAFDVEKAITAGDHKALADYYKAQADAYRQKAAMHETMNMDYSKSKVHYKGMDSTFVAHCSALKEIALKSAQQYDDMAKEEETLASKKKK